MVAKVAHGELQLGIDPKINSVSNIHVTITVPTDGRIKSLAAHSSAEIRSRDLTLTGPKTQLEATSAARIAVSAAADVCKAHASSAATIDVAVRSTRFDAKASSAANIKASLTADECGAEASSAAKIELAGEVRTCEATINSAANLHAEKLAAAIWDIHASSGSDARIHCTAALEAHASSGASIVYSGDCTADVHASSGGSIKKR